MITLAVGAAAALAGALAGRAWVARGGHRRPGETGSAPVGPWVMVAFAVITAAVVATRVGGPLAVAAAIYAAGAAVVSWVDIDVRRVPDAVLVIWTPALALAVAGAGLALGSPALVGRAGIGAAAMGGLYLLAALVGSMGIGDVKLAAVTGMVVGAVSLRAVVVATVAGFAIGAVTALVLLATGRAARDDHLALAPALCAGAVLALAL